MVKYKRVATLAVAGCLSALGLSAAADAATITNPWSGTAGDRANYSAFAFRATAGEFPNSVSPLGALDAFPFLTLDALTFTRPANDTTQTPILGTGNGQLSSVAAPVFVDVYTSRDGILSFSGYLGSSTTSVIFNDGVDPIAPGESFTFSFSGITLDKDAAYWLVFSEDGIEGEVSSFRSRVNTSGNDSTPGPGPGYLVGNIAQVEYSGAIKDWGVEFTATVTAVPEPISLAMLAFASTSLRIRRRRLV
ncbi:MAG TPA: hypothetical protein PKY77_14405 [Phycisphaerae bacterium]|nr:hypothetical protein [Phycisphaerae bacterium]HRY66831.1 hypothetical protein [Phycisphaerae bacterium]HSA26889.1 hypothetical protein [Phycisphaerae bacterium]